MQHQLSSSDMGDELATLADKINKTEEKVQELEAAIKEGGEAALKVLGLDSRDEAKIEKQQLNHRLNTLYDTRKIALTQQQQQTGAGTLMLPVRLAM
jgi:hypothetical protein